MRVYHGSDTQIEVIDLDKCKYGRDFGQGFYKESWSTIYAWLKKELKL
jgi:hypothetical protein